MKRYFAVTLLALALAFGLPPLLLPRAAPAPAADAPARTDAELRLRVLTDAGVQDLSMAEYLPLALAGEMPAAFDPEALKAQAVALRSFALYQREQGKAAHPEADVCADPACCAAWLSEDTLRARWGERYESYAARIHAAVRETDGQYLVWEDHPILAVFHACSLERTEDGAALGLPAPYLQSVSTPETPQTVRQLLTTVEVTPEDFSASLLALCPEADFSGPPETWLGSVSLDAAGRAEQVQAGGQAFSALTLRQVFALRSTDFTLAWDGEKFVFRVCGYGHGLGMSQHGADCMAKQGADYAEILAHYYPGTELVVALR